MRESTDLRESSHTAVVYVLTHHPRVAMTFVADEVRAMRQLGWDIVPVATNSPAASDLDSEWARHEQRRTRYLDQASRWRLTRKLVGLLVRRPRRGASIVSTAVRSAGWNVKLLSRRLGHLLYASAVLDACRESGARHVHAHFGLSPATIAWFASELSSIDDGEPLSWSFTIHGFHDFADPKLARLDLKAEHATFVVCISEFTRDQLQLVADTGDWGKFHVVKCGIDLDRFDFAGDVAIAGVARVLTVARLSPEKGHVVLIKAARRLADRGRPVQLEFVGSGPSLAEVADLAERMRVAVEFQGELSPSQVRLRLDSADVFCLPSFAEGIPVSIMEAMAVGVPVVASDVGGIAELVHDRRTGLIVPAGDDGRLADALAAVIDDESARRAMVASARAEVSGAHQLQRSAESLSRLFEVAIRERQSSS